jgi:ubiquinone/menaquinone biosynthesis C-methylase UbiE
VQEYWDRRIRESRGSLEGVLWARLPIWNDHVDKVQMHHLQPVLEQVKPHHSVLDVGCGVGRLTFRLARLSKETWGIDTSTMAIRTCEEISKSSGISNAHFADMDVRDLQFDNDTFDWVFSITALQCLTTRRDLTLGISEILRVTKKGGTIVLLESTTDRRKDPYNISLSRNEWFQIIEDSGGRIQSWHGVDVAILRNLAFRFLGLAEMVGKNVGRRFAEYAMASLLRPVECSVPRILRNASWYSLILVVKK